MKIHSNKSDVLQIKCTFEFSWEQDFNIKYVSKNNNNIFNLFNFLILKTFNLNPCSFPRSFDKTSCKCWTLRYKQPVLN